MNRIDLIVVKRITGAWAVGIVVMFGIFLLLDSLDYHRFVYLTELGGLPLALTSMAASAGRWTIRTLSVTILSGTTLGMLDLQARQELNIIRASGASVWNVARGPVLAAFALGLVVALFVDSATTQLDRALNPTQATDTGAVTSDGALWLEQATDTGRYVIRGGHVQPGGTVLDDVTMFVFGDPRFSRIIAPEARLEPGAWVVPAGEGYRAAAPATTIAGLRLPTPMTAADLQVRLSSTSDLTVFELAAALLGHISDPLLRNAVLTRFLKLITLPLMMIGSVLIAMSFTAGYRRANKYGGAVLYGILLGFVMFFVTEMADKAGSAGALNPVFAATGPAAIAILVGLTVLLFREDGRA